MAVTIATAAFRHPRVVEVIGAGTITFPSHKTAWIQFYFIDEVVCLEGDDE